eukprot:6183869-Pleurochrysis_carterae.AAC.6
MHMVHYPPSTGGGAKFGVGGISEQARKPFRRAYPRRFISPVPAAAMPFSASTPTAEAIRAIIIVITVYPPIRPPRSTAPIMPPVTDGTSPRRSRRLARARLHAWPRARAIAIAEAAAAAPRPRLVPMRRAAVREAFRPPSHAPVRSQRPPPRCAALCVTSGSSAGSGACALAARSAALRERNDGDEDDDDDDDADDDGNDVGDDDDGGNGAATTARPSAVADADVAVAAAVAAAASAAGSTCARDVSSFGEFEGDCDVPSDGGCRNGIDETGVDSGDGPAGGGTGDAALDKDGDNGGDGSAVPANFSPMIFPTDSLTDLATESCTDLRMDARTRA